MMKVRYFWLKSNEFYVFQQFIANANHYSNAQ